MVAEPGAESRVLSLLHFSRKTVHVTRNPKLETRNFFVNGLGMVIVQRRKNGAIDLSDGSINITVLPMTTNRADGKPPQQGIDHIGFTVEDEADARRRLQALGASEINAIDLGSAHYEVKYQGPEGIVVDLGHWVGTAPIGERQTVTAS
jgi:hypothetical protein